jgi:hypothetical protein
MDFKTASRLGSLISKDYAEDFFTLLVTYRDISASEAASRLDIHTKTAQDFLEGLTSQGYLSKKEVFEQKRPYYRYSLLKKKMHIDIDLSELFDREGNQNKAQWRIREKKNSGAMFKTSKRRDSISSILFFTGRGRTRNEIRFNLTENQGRFLFHLPFPTESFLTVSEIVTKSGIDESSLPEVVDILGVLKQYNIIETQK